MGCSSSQLLPDAQSERDLNALHLLLRLLDEHVNGENNVIFNDVISRINALTITKSKTNADPEYENNKNNQLLKASEILSKFDIDIFKKKIEAIRFFHMKWERDTIL
jgi:hypothetical protein